MSLAGSASESELQPFLRLTEQLALVRSVSSQITNLTDLDELCRRITQLIQQTFNYYYVSILTCEKDGTTLVFRASAGQSGTPSESLGITIHKGEGIIGQVALTGEELLANDIRLEPRYRYHPSLPHTRAEFALPLRAGNRLLGILDVQSDQVNVFNETDQVVLRALADHIAVAMEGARLYRDLQQQSDQINTIFQISRALASILDTDQLLETAAQLIEKNLGYPYVHIFTVHPGRRKIFYAAGSGVRNQTIVKENFFYDLDDVNGMIPWVARNGQYLLANDVSQQPLYRPSPFPPQNTQSEFVLPLKFGKDVLGVLDIQSDQLNGFDEKQLPLFEALAANLATAMRNAALYRSEQWRRQVADSFREVSRLISANVALGSLLDTILSELERNLPCDATAIWLIEEESNPTLPAAALHLAAARGADPERVAQAMQSSLPINEWFNWALESDQAAIRRKNDPPEPLGLALDLPEDYSCLVAPLRSGERTIGILAMVHRLPGRYGSEALGMASTFANYAAVAIQNARLYADAQSQAWVATILLQVAETIQDSETVEDLLTTIVRLIPLLVGVRNCAIFRWFAPQNAFALQSWYGFDLPDQAPQYFSEDSSPALQKLRQEKDVIFIQDIGRELGLPGSDEPDIAEVHLLIPLLAHNELLGGLFLTHRVANTPGTQQALDQQTLSILQGIAHQTATALENLSLLEARQVEGYITAVLLQVAQAVSSQNELDDILSTIVHLMPILVGIDSPVIYLWDSAQQIFHPIQAYARSRQETEVLLNKNYPAGTFALLDEVFKKNRPHFARFDPSHHSSDDWSHLVVFPADEPNIPAGSASEEWIIGTPITIKGELLGVLVAHEAGVAPAFRDRRLEIINGIAQQIGLAIQNENLKKEMFARERLEREMQLARQIQQTFLPSHFPRLAGWELEARWQPARTVGGDFYDVFRLGRKRLGLVIADVSDKGMPAALYMAVTRSLIRAQARKGSSPAAVLEQVNNLLLEDARNGMFVTIIYAITDLETGVVTYANAGHNRPLLLRCQPRGIEVLPKGGLALAVIKNQPQNDERIQLEPGDCLLLYTDGVTDNFSPDGEAFGEERLMQLIQNFEGQEARAMLDHLDHTLAAFRQGLPPSDDITLLTIRRLKAE